MRRIGFFGLILTFCSFGSWGCSESEPPSKEDAIKARQEAQKDKGPGGKYMLPKGAKVPKGNQ